MEHKSTKEFTRQMIHLTKEEVYEAVLHWARARSQIYIPMSAKVNLYDMLTRENRPGVILWTEE